MSNPVPSQLALTNIADGSPRIAAPVRNNFSAIQTFCNAINTLLSGGSVGQLLSATDASDVQWIDAPARTLQALSGAPLTSVSGTTTETDLFTPYSLAGGLLGTTNEVEIILRGDLLNNTGVVNHGFTPKLYYGATAVAGDKVIVGTAGTNRYPFIARLSIAAQGATNSQLLSGAFVMLGSASLSQNAYMIPSPSTTGIAAGAATIDSTTAQNIRVTATNDSNSGSIAVRVYAVRIRVIN